MVLFCLADPEIERHWGRGGGGALLIAMSGLAPSMPTYGAVIFHTPPYNLLGVGVEDVAVMI